MSTNWPPDFCPYKGLQPYTEQDRAFFFGRERDQRIIISNLFAAPLTVFYGASGVGKSSVLLAGAVPELKKERNLTVVVFRSWQDSGFLSQLKEKTAAAVSKTANKELNIDLSLSLDDLLAQISQTARGSIFFVFDQFEEYFLYNPPGPSSETFEAQFARVINRRDVSAHFLLSMREDGLSKLDRFQGRIPTLLNNMLRLEHLDRDGAKAAITKPLDVYNQGLKEGQAAVTIEPALVESVLEDLRGAKVTSEQVGQGAVSNSQSTPQACEIETPLLQMVMTRLWEQERTESSLQLRLQTFEKLGRAANIARTHLDNMMARLSEPERADAARVLRYMVTPSGTKIAQEVGALASWTELSDAQVQAILTRLSEPDMRILRTIQAPGEALRYEIFHDVLAQAILDWRRRFDTQQQEERIRLEEQARRAEEQEEAEQRREKERGRMMRRALVGLSIALVLMVGLLLVIGVQTYRARAAALREKAAKDLLSAQIASRDHVREGVRQAQKHKFEEAIAEYDLAIQADADNLLAYSNKGYAQMRLGDLTKGDSALKQNRYAASVETLQYLTAKDSSYALGHYNLALAYIKVGKEGEAIQEADTVLKLDADYCKTFKEDSNYKWFLSKREYMTPCKPAATSSPTPQ
jgi:tetratricopeptide (TPR) repeat protein